MGSQRSPTVAAAYLIKYYGLNVKEAINFVKSKRMIAFYGGNVNFKPFLKMIYSQKTL
jgi:protein-tyrosine phosphatase